jgi:drug/metabolite transporter (DMT)-like permease
MFAGLALLSSLLWGTADFLGGVLAKRFAALAVTGASQAVGLLVGVSALVVTSDWKAPSLSFSGYAVCGICAGAAGFVGLVSYYAGLSTGKMGVIAPITSLSAIIPVTYGFIQGERPQIVQLVGMVIALLGCFLASGPEMRSGVSAKPLLLGALTAVMFGIALVFMARGAKVDSLLTMTTMRLTTVLVALAIAIKVRGVGGFTLRDLPTLAAIGAADFLANYTLGIATTKGLVSIAMVLGSVFPVVTTILAFKFLNERLKREQYVGVLLAVIGVACISLA